MWHGRENAENVAQLVVAVLPSFNQTTLQSHFTNMIDETIITK